MKGKITIVLLGLALVFGMIAASCDNDAFPAPDAKDKGTLLFYWTSKDPDTARNGLPIFYKMVEADDNPKDALGNYMLGADGQKLPKVKTKTVADPVTDADDKTLTMITTPVTGQDAWDWLYGERAAKRDQFGAVVMKDGKPDTDVVRGKLLDGSIVQKYVLSHIVNDPTKPLSAELVGMPIIVENPVWVAAGKLSIDTGFDKNP